jgi:hypothetical protein
MESHDAIDPLSSFVNESQLRPGAHATHMQFSLPVRFDLGSLNAIYNDRMFDKMFQ